MKNPLEPTWKSEALPILLVIAAFLASFYFYGHFPAKVPMHWNFQGQVDNWGSPAFAAFFFPFMNLGLYLLFLVLPYIDPKKNRYEEFKKTFHVFKNLIIAFMTFIYFLVGLNGLGYPVPVGTFVPFFVGILFIVIGNFMGKIKSNWMMGLRTPWTLSSENVWNKSNRFAGKLFMIGGVVMMSETIIPNEFKLPVFIVCVASMVIVPTLYSYILFIKEKKGL